MRRTWRDVLAAADRDVNIHARMKNQTMLRTVVLPYQDALKSVRRELTRRASDEFTPEDAALVLARAYPDDKKHTETA